MKRNNWKRAMGLSMLGASLLTLATSQPAQAAGVLPSAVFDENEAGWVSRRDMTWAQWQAHFDARKRDYMPVDVDVSHVDGALRYAAVWRKNGDKRPWAVLHGLTSAQFSSTWNLYRRRGYLLVDQEAYVHGNSQRYSALFVKNREALRWGSQRNLTSAQFNDRYQWAQDNGYIVTDFEVYKTPAGADRLSVIWVDNVEGLDWTLRRALSSTGYARVFAQLSRDHRVVDFESYRVNGKQRYGAIFHKNVNGRQWRQRRGMSSKTFGDYWKRYLDAGYRLVDFERYSTGSGDRYAGVWRQNSMRPSWEHRVAVDQLLEEELSDFDVPAISVAVMQDGEYLYLRGLGFADVANQRIATSNTVYRLASVSKPVGGALALDLQERGLIDLSAPTASYVPGLPAAHTHSVAQTAQMRAGIGHYAHHATPNSGPYATALAPTSELWSVSPVVPVGQYLYSTHSWTYLASAFEGALGDDIFDVFEDEWRGRYGLGSLRPEDTGLNVSERAEIYATNNDLIANRDDLSWKVLGGGLEGSAKDVARVFDRMQRGQILQPATMDTFLTPVSGSTGYGYGISTSDNWACTRRVGKSGGQSGANSFLLLYPELEVTIVVLSNRRFGGHSATGMADAIGDLIRSTECP